MKEGTLFVMEDTIRSLTNDLPKLEGLIVTHLSGKAMRTLVFLLQKASEVTRLFNKQKSGSRARERVKILENLNTVLQNPDSTVHEIEEAEVKLTEFDEEDIRQILQKNENYRMLKTVNHLITITYPTLRWKRRSLTILQPLQLKKR